MTGKKVKQSLYGLGQALRVPGGCQSYAPAAFAPGNITGAHLF